MTDAQDLNPSAVPLGAMAERIGMKLVSASALKVVGTLPVEGNTQPFGLLNGAASMALVETLGSIAANLHAGPGRYAVGIDISGTHHKAAMRGIVTGTATPLSAGKTVATYEVIVTDDSGDRLCTGRITCLLRDAR